MPLRHTASDLAQRLTRLNPVTRLRSRIDTVRVKKLIHLVGLKRSGTHATANWILGKDSQAVLVNNSPFKKLGAGTPMARTLSSSPLPIHLHRASPAIALGADGSECPVRLRSDQDLVVVLWQSQSLHHLSEHTLVRGLSPESVQTVLLLRDPFNWMASVLAKGGVHTPARQLLSLWRDYAREYEGSSSLLRGCTPVSYNRWLRDSSYRMRLAADLGLSGSERQLETVTAHAGGSSFDGTEYHHRASSMQLEERWQNYAGDAAYAALFEAHPDVVDLAMRLFELPAELEQYARARRVSGS